MFIATSIFVQAQTQKIKIQFEGNKVFSSDVLLQKLNTLLPDDSHWNSKYDEDQLRYCLEKTVLVFLRSEGYLMARIGELKTESDERNLTVTVPIKEGIIHRLGNVKIKGTKFFTPEQLLQQLSFKKGGIFDAKDLREWLFERVKAMYENNGYIEQDVESNPTLKPATAKIEYGIVDLTIVIDEGQQFTVSQIEFVGNGQASEPYLKTLMFLKEGEIFNKQLLVDGFKKLDELNLFERINYDKYVSLVKDDEKSLVKIKIEVRELKP
ncbi:MAG: hypothetical protein H7Z37_18245 [Pyrinomonadaceae bacterium]|nr:hypothetical protein [Pyrinomonadaceae bacterium]